jgi:hypothetical protein
MVVRFLNERANKADTVFQIKSCEIAPFKTKTQYYD